jgi:hypothetical protein
VPVTDVSIYVALITGGAGAIGAATPQLATVFRDNRQASRDRQERGVSARQQAYVELLGAAADLRTRVANTAMYSSETLVRLAEIRGCAADAQVRAAKVAFLADELAEPAGALASAATDLAAAAVQNTDMTTNVMRSPDFTSFDEAVDEFKLKATGNAGK